MTKKVNRSRRIHTVEQMRAALRRLIKDSGLSQADFARSIGDSPEALSLTLTRERGLSRRAQRYLGVQREIMYRDKA